MAAPAYGRLLEVSRTTKSRHDVKVAAAWVSQVKLDSPAQCLVELPFVPFNYLVISLQQFGCRLV